MFWFRCLAVLELPGAVFFVEIERDARGRWHRSGDWMQAEGVFAVLWGGLRGTPEKGGIGPGVDAGGDVFEVLRGGCG